MHFGLYQRGPVTGAAMVQVRLGRWTSEVNTRITRGPERCMLQLTTTARPTCRATAFYAAPVNKLNSANVRAAPARAQVHNGIRQRRATAVVPERSTHEI